MELGTALLPVLKSVVKIVKGFAEAVQSLPAPIKGVLATLTALMTIMSAVVGPILVQIAAISWLGLSYRNLKTQVLKTIGALRKFAVSAVSSLAPLLPYIAIIGAVVGAILLLQDVLVKGWEKSYLGKFVNWLSEKLPFLKPIFEGVGKAVVWLKEKFEWLSCAIGSTITTIQTIFDKLGPLKYLLLGPVGGIVYLITHFDKLKQSITSVPDAIGKFLDRLGPLKYLLLGPVGSIILLIRNIDRLKYATSSALTSIKSLWDRTIGWIITKIDEFITKIKQAWDFIAKSPIGKAIETAFSFTPAGAILNAIKIVQPRIKPVIEKPEMDKRFYEEGSVVLKVKTPKIKPEIEKPELSWLEQLYLRVKPLFEMTGIPELTGIIRYIPDVVKPEVRNLMAGVTYIPKLVKPEITHELTRITPTPSQLVSSTVVNQPTHHVYNIKHEHRTIQVPKIEIHLKNGDKETIKRALREIFEQDFASHGIY